MKKIFFTAVITIMCMCSFVFGGAGNSHSVRKLDAEQRPFEVFTTLEQLNAYRASHEGDFFNLTEEEYGKYDEKFFDENAVVMFLTQGMSGSIKCVAEKTRFENDKLYVTVKELSPSMHTMDLHYNTLAVSVSKDIVKDIKSVFIEAYRVDI